MLHKFSFNVGNIKVACKGADDFLKFETCNSGRNQVYRIGW